MASASAGKSQFVVICKMGLAFHVSELSCFRVSVFRRLLACLLAIACFGFH